MARPVSDEELQLKKRARRRLVGAVVLVSIVAVVLPMVLDSEPQSPSQNVDIHIPPPDAFEGKAKSAASGVIAEPRMSDDLKTAPVEEAATQPSAASSTPASPVAAAASEVVRPDETVAAKSVETKPSRADEPKKETSPAAKEKEAAPKATAGAYVVQVAALSDAAKAKQLERQMAGAGLRTYTEVVSTGAGQVTRVRAGPYPTREAAEKARTQLKKAGLDGKVVPK